MASKPLKPSSTPAPHPIDVSDIPGADLVVPAPDATPPTQEPVTPPPDAPPADRPKPSDSLRNIKDFVPKEVQFDDSGAPLATMDDLVPPAPKAPEPTREEPVGNAAKALRIELENANREKKVLEQELEALRTFKSTADQERSGFESKLTERERELNEIKAKAALGDLTRHPDVQAIQEPWNKKVLELVDYLNIESDTGRDFENNVGELVREYGSLGSPTSEGYNDRRQAFMERIDSYGSANRQQIVQTLREGIQVIQQSEQKKKYLMENADQVQFQQYNQHYQTEVQRFEEIKKSFLNLDPENIAKDPLAADSVIASFINSDPKYKTAHAQIEAFAQHAILPPPPPNPTDRAKFPSEEDYNNHLKKQWETHNHLKKAAQAGIVRGTWAVRIMPSLMKEITDLRAALKQRRLDDPKIHEQPPEMNKSEPEPTGPQDPKKFVPKDVDLTKVPAASL
jgi:hypothetical protein